VNYKKEVDTKVIEKSRKGHGKFRSKNIIKHVKDGFINIFSVIPGDNDSDVLAMSVNTETLKMHDMTFLEDING
jgi:hypothetical protein